MINAFIKNISIKYEITLNSFLSSMKILMNILYIFKV